MRKRGEKNLIWLCNARRQGRWPDHCYSIRSAGRAREGAAEESLWKGLSIRSELMGQMLTPDHPELELKNNLAENSMRPVALGRRNWIHLEMKAGLKWRRSSASLKLPPAAHSGARLPGRRSFRDSMIFPSNASPSSRQRPGPANAHDSANSAACFPTPCVSSTHTIINTPSAARRLKALLANPAGSP